MIDLCEPALALGHVDVVEPVLGWLAGAELHGPEADARTRFPATRDEGLAAAAGVVGAGIAALTGRPAPPWSVPAGGRPDPLVGELLLVLPLLRVVAGARGRDEAVGLPLPTVGGDRRDLWRVARDLVVADLGGCPVAARDLTCGRTARAYRDAVVAESFLSTCPAEVRPAWTLVAARLGRLTGDVELCRVARELLRPVREQFALLGRLLPIGPVGWFLADVEHLLGHDDDAREANLLAERVSRRAGARAWTARCRLQRLRLAGGGAVPEPREPARPGHGPGSAPGARGTGAGGTGAGGPDAGRAGAEAVGSPPDPLSPRQRRILELAARGLTNVQIAQELFLSVATVERHCTLAYRALGVRNRAQALGLLAASAASAPSGPSAPNAVADVPGQGSVS